MLDLKDIVTLDDDNKYAVVGKANLDNKMYYYLLDINDVSKYKFGYVEDNALIVVYDKATIKKLVPLFATSLRGILKYEEK